MLRLILFLFICTSLLAQVTEGTITGRIFDARTQRGVERATVTCTNLASGQDRVVHSDDEGRYTLVPLPPGSYYLRAELLKGGRSVVYQPREVDQLEVAVAGRIDVDFPLRPLSDVYDQGLYATQFIQDSDAIVHTYASDVQARIAAPLRVAHLRHSTPEATLSNVIDPAQLRELPFFGRDAYSMLATQAGVSSNTSTSRGLGLAASGQRPSSANIMIDGLEANNYLISGPLVPLAPESIQEYRISNNYFSAEFGNTSGYLATAVSRSGGREWHGVGYGYFRNRVLNASNLASSKSKPPEHESQIGVHAGGPILRGRLFSSFSLERLTSRGHSAETEYRVPSRAAMAELGEFYSGSLAHKLLTQFPPPLSVAGAEPNVGVARLSAPVTLDRDLQLGRADYTRGAHRIFGRVLLAQMSRPDFIWSPYEAFVSGLTQPVQSIALALITSPTPNSTGELRLGRSQDELSWTRAHPEIPTLVTLSGTWLPGSPAAYEYSNRSRAWQISYTHMWSRGRHAARFGGGALIRSIANFQSVGRDGQYAFDDIYLFEFGIPRSFRAALAREGLAQGQLRAPDYSRRYTYNQFHAFAQDTVRATPRLALNFGIRYENFGAPEGTGDAVVELGPGTGLPQKISTASLRFGQRHLFDSDDRGVAGRFGFTWDPSGSARTVLRGAYGIFYDRPFDNLWLTVANNAYVVPTGFRTRGRADFLEPVPSVLPGYTDELRSQGITEDFPPLTYIQQDLKNAYTHHAFLGIQRQITENLWLETNGLLSLGRRLLTTDVVNRQFSLPAGQRYNPSLPDISYRGNEGLSSYTGLTAILRYRSRRGFLHLAYTWSHSIDLQSEPLGPGDFTNLVTAVPGVRRDRRNRAAFARQMNARLDRGNSDFDQRHNLVFYSSFELPSFLTETRAAPLFRNWSVAQVAAVRSGFPFTVNTAIDTPGDGGALLQNRAAVTDPDKVMADRQTACAVSGCGIRILNPAAFAVPQAGSLGNSGRNAFTGPGFYNVDFSLARRVAVPVRDYRASVTIRVDVFNILNHSNLDQPASFFDPLDPEGFGIATYGRRGASPGFPSLAPFAETAREIQLVLKIEF